MKRRDEVLVGMVITVSLIMGFVGALWLARGGRFPFGVSLSNPIDRKSLSTGLEVGAHRSG